MKVSEAYRKPCGAQVLERSCSQTFKNLKHIGKGTLCAEIPCLVKRLSETQILKISSPLLKISSQMGLASNSGTGRLASGNFLVKLFLSCQETTESQTTVSPS